MSTGAEKTPQKDPRHLPRWMCIGMVIMGISSFFAVGYMLCKALYMLGLGRGLETYRTAWLVQYDWIGFLALIGATVVALLAAFASHLYKHMKWRKLERKLKSKYGSLKK